MKRIAIIGAGQLGSRHLQGLAKTNVSCLVEVVEPFECARDTAKQRFKEIPSNEKIKKIDFYEKISELSNELDLVVIATNADVRFKVVAELLKNKKIKNLVLEKVLFQKISDYKEIKQLLEQTNTKCWVNHPRRMFPFYKKMKEQLSNSKNIHFSISGGSWGLGCNGLHFLDCIEYISNTQNIELDTKYLNKKLYETKRAGFKEINGMITGKADNYTFVINCFEENVSPVQFNITSDSLNILIDEANGWYKISKKNDNWQHEIKNEKIIYFQSELTNKLVEEIFNNTCFLPTYNEAMDLHIKYLEKLIEHINSFSETKYDFCPIT